MWPDIYRYRYTYISVTLCYAVELRQACINKMRCLSPDKSPLFEGSNEDVSEAVTVCHTLHVLYIRHHAFVLCPGLGLCGSHDL